MPDVLIRAIDDETLRNIDATAERLGLSRHEFLKREVVRLGHRGPRSATLADLKRATKVLEDLGDEEIMGAAWS